MRPASMTAVAVPLKSSDSARLARPDNNNGTTTLPANCHPLFWVPEGDCSSAEMPPAEKNRFSHRARAMALLKQRLGI